MKINDLFQIKRDKYNHIVVETISVNPNHPHAKRKNSVRTNENYFTKLEQACSYSLNKYAYIESLSTVVKFIEQANTEITAAIRDTALYADDIMKQLFNIIQKRKIVGSTGGRFSFFSVATTCFPYSRLGLPKNDTQGLFRLTWAACLLSV